jgi:hypothetical protein
MEEITELNEISDSIHVSEPSPVIQPVSYTVLVATTIVENVKEHDLFLTYKIVGIQGTKENGYTLTLQLADGSLVEKAAQWDTPIATVVEQPVVSQPNTTNYFVAASNKRGYYYCPECNQEDMGCFSIRHVEGCSNRDKLTIF